MLSFRNLSKITSKSNLQTSLYNMLCINNIFICKMGRYFTCRKKKYWTSLFYLISTGFQINMLHRRDWWRGIYFISSYLLHTVGKIKWKIFKLCYTYETCFVGSSVLSNVLLAADTLPWNNKMKKKVKKRIVANFGKYILNYWRHCHAIITCLKQLLYTLLWTDIILQLKETWIFSCNFESFLCEYQIWLWYMHMTFPRLLT